MNTATLFAAVRSIKAAPLTQADVDLVNRALMGDVAKASAGQRVSAAGVGLIHSFESLRLTAYADPGSRDGLPVTNGWGSTTDLNGNRIKLGAAWTKEYADAVFARDLVAFETGVNLLLQGKAATQGQFDSLVCFAYNVGLDIDNDTAAEGLGDSTLLKRHLAGDYAGAQAAFAAWNKNDGKVMNGLVRRRAAEAARYGQSA